MKKIIVLVVVLLTNSLYATTDLAFLGCDPHADCMREVTIFDKKIRWEDVTCAQVRFICRTVECPKLDKDVQDHINTIRASQAGIVSQLAIIEKVIEQNSVLAQQNTTSINQQTNTCNSLNVFKDMVFTDINKKNNFVRVLATVTELDSSNKKLYFEQIEQLPIQDDIKAQILAIIKATHKSSNDLKLIVDQYSRNNSTGIDELLASSAVDCEKTKESLLLNDKTFIEQKTDQENQKIDLNKQYNDLENQVVQQEKRKC